MQTRTFSDLFKTIQSLAGVTAFANNEVDDIINLIERRFKVAYDSSNMWPRYLVSSEPRPVSAFTLRGIDYLSGVPGVELNQAYQLLGKDSNGNDVYTIMNDDKVSSVAFIIESNIWKLRYTTNITIDEDTGVVDITEAPVAALLQQNTDIDSKVHDSPLKVKAWERPSGSTTLSLDTYPIFEERSLIPWKSTVFNSTRTTSSPTGKASRPDIAEVVRVHRNQPFNKHSAVEYDFYLDDYGITIINPNLNEDGIAYVTYRKKWNPLGVPTEYVLTASTAVPDEFFNYIAYATYSDFLRMDGQHDKAQLEQENANMYLAQELEKVDVIMNNNTVNQRFTTYVNRQSR
jgi:hypothetical protein